MDLRKIGRIAAKILLDKIGNGDGTHDIRPAFPTRFIIRHSCGASPAP
jgi:DNA-binding LacI/PurR family transcriptional regulator